MKNYEKQSIEQNILISVECSKCKEIILPDEYGNLNFLEIQYQGSYGSKYPGDLTKLEAELCEDCMREIFDNIATISHSKIY